MQSDVRRAPVVAAFCPSPSGRAPVEFALEAGRLSGRPVVAAAVVDRGHTGGTLWHLDLERARRAFGELDVRVFEDETPARGLARALDELAPALIALGARPEPPRLGSTARRVLHVSSCPVAIVPTGYTRPRLGMRAVGAAYAARPEARDAIRAAAAFARVDGGRLRVIGAVDHVHDRAAARAAIREAVSVLAPDVDADVEVPVGAPVDGLVVATRGLDLLVLGSRGSGPPRAVRLGTVSRAVVDRAVCPVLLLPRGATAAEPRRPAAAGNHTGLIPAP